MPTRPFWFSKIFSQIIGILELKFGEYLGINIVSNLMALDEQIFIFMTTASILCLLFSRSLWAFTKLVPGKEGVPCSEPAFKMVVSDYRKTPNLSRGLNKGYFLKMG